MTTRRDTLILALAAALAAVTASARPAPDESAFDWYDGTAFTVEGTAFSEPGRAYARLPASAEGKVPGPVWNMSAHATGVNVRFVPQGDRLCFKWSVDNPDAVDAFMGPTAMTGLDVYRQEADGTWKFAANPRIYFYDRKTPGVYEMGWQPGRPCMVYLPLRTFVKSFQVGVKKGTAVAPMKPPAVAVVRTSAFSSPPIAVQFFPSSLQKKRSVMSLPSQRSASRPFFASGAVATTFLPPLS